MIKMQSKIKAKEIPKEITRWYEINMMKIDPRAIGFTSGFSREHKYSTVGEQITIEQLTELSIIMRISRHDHVYSHHVRDKWTETILHLLLLLTHRPLSSMHLEY